MSAEGAAQGGEACTICEVVRGETGKTVFETETLVLSLSDRYPFGLVICTKRHGDGLADLNAAEAAEFGRLASRAAAEMRREWTPWVYLTAFGEEQPHFHAMLHARFVPISEAFHNRLSGQVEEMAGESETSKAYALQVGTRLAQAW